MNNILSEAMNFQSISINNRDYFIIDTLENLRAEDSFIHNQNKLDRYTGSGEARKYVGPYIGKKGESLSKFFEFNNWGKVDDNGERLYSPIQTENCFFSKQNLINYLKDSEREYRFKEQIYKNNISLFYQARLDELKSVNKEILNFTIYDVSDLKHKTNRAYIRSDSAIWKIWRKLILPNISYLTINKLFLKGDKAKKPYYFFRVFVDYHFREISHPSLIEEAQKVSGFGLDDISLSHSRSRPWQKEFKQKVLRKMPQCPFTFITDERLLIGSHIKPVAVCYKEDRLDQAKDPLNGLSLTPTYDKLFNDGYITFSDKSELICGTKLSNFTWASININPRLRKTMKIDPKGREEYLEYHRDKVFNG